MSPTILVTGATGFLGRAVVSALQTGPQGSRLRLLVHSREPEPDVALRAEWRVVDLADPSSLAGTCAGIDTVLHLASYVGDETTRCESVNAGGTEALVTVALAAGVRRFLYVSNAAVYGYAVHRGASEDEVTLAPATPVSRSRVRAERAILGAGGVVLRPLFIYGDGDTRFLPAVMRGLARVPFLIGRGRARLSVIAVDDLASVVAYLAGWLGPWPTGVYHATDGQPVTFREIAAVLRECLGVRVPRMSLPYPVASRIVRLTSSAVLGDSGWTESAAHRLFLVTRDHFYDASRLWQLVPFDAGAAIGQRLAEFAEWYQQFLPDPRPSGSNERH